MHNNFRNNLYRVVQNGPSVRLKARRTLAGRPNDEDGKPTTDKDILPACVEYNLPASDEYDLPTC